MMDEAYERAGDLWVKESLCSFIFTDSSAAVRWYDDASSQQLDGSHLPSNKSVSMK